MNIKIKRVRKGAIIPTRAHKGDAGYDLYACLNEPITIEPGKTVKIPTGISIAVPDGYFGGIFARSGLATKQGLRPANCVAVCDAPYRGEYMIPLHNDSDREAVINDGDRVAQLVILPYLTAEFVETDKLDDTQRGDDGFGSTGL